MAETLVLGMQINVAVLLVGVIMRLKIRSKERERISCRILMNPRHKGYKRILHCHWCEDTSRCHDANGMKKVNSLNMTRTDFILRTLCDAGHKEHKQIFVDLYKFTEQEAQEMENTSIETPKWNSSLPDICFPLHSIWFQTFCNCFSCLMFTFTVQGVQ